MRNKLGKELQTAGREGGSRKNPTSADYSKDERGGQQKSATKVSSKSEPSPFEITSHT